MSTTYDLNQNRRPTTTRTWLALGAAATAVAVLVMIIAVSCSGVGPTQPAGAGTPGPAASAGAGGQGTDTGGEAGGASGQSTAGLGNQGGQEPGNDAPGGQDAGGDGAGGDEPDGDDTDQVHPVFPIPIVPTLSAEVYEPLLLAPCLGRGTIFVEGIVLVPIEVEYQWIKIGKFGLANEPLTDKVTVVFDEPGHQHVPALLPDSDVERVVQLRIYGAETIYSNPVAYPACP